LLPHESEWWEFVEVAERYADGEASELELYDADETACTLSDEVVDRVSRFACKCVSETTKNSSRAQLDLRAWDSAATALEGDTLQRAFVQDSPQQIDAIIERWADVRLTSDRPQGSTETHVFAPLVDTLRDIFGNPFRPVTFDPDWRTSTAVAIAQAAYDSREFGNLPVLADALQDAGCENADVLDHLRGPGPHVRGCWVVDLVLGKA
jgi:hypothetical protein